MGYLDKTSVLITGGGSGIGRAVVTRFLAEGARVLVFDRSADKLADVRENEADGVETVQGDVTSLVDNVRAVDAAVSAFGGLDVFIGNAGIWDFSRSLVDSPGDDLATGFDELMAVNVKGYLLGAKASVGALRESRGTMIFTLSNAAFFPGGGGPLYTMSKHAGLGLVRQLAYELAPEVRVNGVAPGGAGTDLRGPASMGMSRQSMADVPLGEVLKKTTALEREPKPEDYAGAYLLLASRTDSITTTGTVFDTSSVGTPRRPTL